MRVLEVVNVDFSLRHFLWPLMRGLRDRGHEVVGACAEGRLLEEVRADGFDVRAVPMARSFDPAAQLRAFRALRALIREVKPDLVHGHMPISGFLSRAAAKAEARAAAAAAKAKWAPLLEQTDARVRSESFGLFFGLPGRCEHAARRIRENITTPPATPGDVGLREATPAETPAS